MNKPYKPGAVNIVSMANPQIFYIDDFLPEEAFDVLEKNLGIHDDKFEKASVVDSETGGSTTSYLRSNKTASLSYEDLGSASVFRDLAAGVLRLHYTQAEHLSVIKYDLGEEYAPHHDCFTEETLAVNNPNAGQRIFTALLYCTDVKEGGQTIFPKLNIEIEAKRNRCVFFSLTHTGTGIQLDDALHGSKPVIRGNKVAINLWFRAHVYNTEEYQKSLDKENV